jgi:hypothetical protein
MANPESSINAIEGCLIRAKALEESNEKIFIEACNEVKAAEARNEGAIKDVHLEWARKFKGLAKSAFLQASESVKDAEARLEAAKKTFPFIDLRMDEDDESVDDGDKKPAAIPAVARLQEAAASAGSNKRAAASSSQTATQSKRQTLQSVSDNEQAESNTEVQNSATSDPGQPFYLAQEIEITGCGTQEANGTPFREIIDKRCYPILQERRMERANTILLFGTQWQRGLGDLQPKLGL